MRPRIYICVYTNIHAHMHIHFHKHKDICFKHLYAELPLPDISVCPNKQAELLSEALVMCVKMHLANMPQPAEELLLINLSARE